MIDEVSPIEALDSIKELFDNEDRHCKHVAARDARGNPAYAHGKNARSWCIEGAYYRLGLDQNMAVRYLHEASNLLYETELIKLNDTLGYAAILNVIDEALSLAQDIEDAIEMEINDSPERKPFLGFTCEKCKFTTHDAAELVPECKQCGYETPTRSFHTLKKK